MDEIDKLISMMENTGKHVFPRARAARSLGEYNDVRALAALNKAVADPTFPKTVREAAGISLQETGDSSSIPFLIKALSGDWEVVGQARRALVRLVDESSISMLEEALKDRNTIFEAIRLLGEIKGRNVAAQFLIKVLEGTDTAARRVAIESLAKTGDFSGVAPIAACLLDKDPEVRKTALENLFEFCDVSAVPYLLKATMDENQYIALSSFTLLDGAAKECGSISDILTYEKHIADFLGIARKISFPASPNPQVVALQITLASQRDRLTQKHDILLTDIPKPLKKGGIYKTLDSRHKTISGSARRTVRNE